MNLPTGGLFRSILTTGQVENPARDAHFERLTEIFTWVVIAFGVALPQIPIAQGVNKTAAYTVAIGLGISSIIWFHLLAKKFSSRTRRFLYTAILILFVSYLVHQTNGIQSYGMFFYFIALLPVTVSLPLPHNLSLMVLIIGLIFYEAATGRGGLEGNFSLALLHSWLVVMFVMVNRFNITESTASKEVEEEKTLEKEKFLGKLKDEFVSLISNKLKQPAQSITGYLDTIFAQYSSTLSTETRELVDMAKVNSTRLNKLLDDLLNASEIEHGSLKVNLADVFLLPIVNEVISSQSFDARSKKITLLQKGDANIAAKADADRLKEVLTNLVGNAIKYTPEGGQVVVEVKDAGEFALVSVSDNGIGISPEEQDHLFEKFYRAENDRTKGIKGSGLGLFITKNLVEKMGGEIGATSQPGHGSTFYFKLPRYRW